MGRSALEPRIHSIVSSLKACGKEKDLYQGLKLHADISNNGLFEENTYVGNTVISMYAKCGALSRARDVHEELSVHDAASWNALIFGYVQQGQGEEALTCFQKMRNEGLLPNTITYAGILKACGAMQDAEMGKRVHGELVLQEPLETNVKLSNALVHMYATCGALTKAQKVVENMRIRDVFSWSALITGYAQQGQGEEALSCYRRMQSDSLSPDMMTYGSILKACGITREMDVGKMVHDEILSQGLLEKDVVLGTALVDMYAKCGVLNKAQVVLDELPVRNIVSWSALIAGYAQHGQGEKALSCYRQMRSEGLSPNAVTYSCTLRACGMTQEVETGKKVHDEIINRGLLMNNVVLGNALVDMYAKCGIVVKAQEVFDELATRDVVTWNALMGGYLREGQAEKVLSCFHRMQKEGCSPDAITYTCFLKACGITQDVTIGKIIHDEIASQRLLANDVTLGTALIDMYAKCGVLAKAQTVLDELPIRNVVSWSALIAGYADQGQGEHGLDSFRRMRIEGLSPNVGSWNALVGGFSQQGLAEEALGCFWWMQREGTPPNSITFVNILNACSHSGLVDEGQMYFETMREKYGITPNKEHHTCMVDLYGRARHFDKAIIVCKLLSFDYGAAWSALLAACREWGDVKLGKLAFEHALQLDGGDAPAHVLMANIYAAAGIEGDVQDCVFSRV